ncbi:MAG TPA: DUF1186 domain-containing protein [Reyranella sp.]|nr:DUF1186 domain-containing protein [Reyranella sp.]
MAVDPAADWGPDASIEYHVLDLALLPQVSESAVTACMQRYPEAGPHLRSALEGFAAGGRETNEKAQGLFRALHIMGEMRDSQACAPLLRLLGRDPEEVGWLLGDAITETLPRILVGVFDGDADALFEAIADQDRDELVRASLLRAATFLTWEGRIDRAVMVAFLVRFGSGELAVETEFVWHGWVDAIALLGLRHLEPLVTQALAKGLIDEFIFERDEFDASLERAERNPAEISRFTDVGMGHLDDVLNILRDFDAQDDEQDEEASARFESVKDMSDQPVINPFRHVGRNDPCPCGSGKKAKRCCLAA